MNVTDSASAAASNLLNLQVASASKLAVGKDGAVTVTSAAADAIAVGPNGATNPAFVIDASTASAATGIKIVPNAAASGVAVSVVSSGTNENVTLDAKGSGTVTINGTATGGITLSRAATLSSTLGVTGATTLSSTLGVSGTVTGTSTSASALAVGANGATNPVLKVNANTASVATGLHVTGAAEAAGLALAVISSGADENLTVDGKGAGTVTINGTATGAISLARATTVTGALGVTGAGTITSTSASALTAGANGATNPVLKINANTASVATGLEVVGAAAAGGLAVKVISSGTNENMTLDAKGSGTLTVQGTATGAITLTRAVTAQSTITAWNAIKSSHATAGIGYITGAGGAVTQITSRTTGVTLNTVCGAITLVSAAGDTTPATFTVTNSAVAATDIPFVVQKSGTDLYDISVSAVAAGSFNITFNTKSGTTTEQPVFNFIVMKGVAA